MALGQLDPSGIRCASMTAIAVSLPALPTPYKP